MFLFTSLFICQYYYQTISQDIEIMGKAGKIVRLVRVMRVMRIFKLVRYFAGLQSLIFTLNQVSHFLFHSIRACLNQQQE